MSSGATLVRQCLLAEVGEAGQARLARARLCVAQGNGADGALAGEVEREYLLRAGVGEVSAVGGASAVGPVAFAHARFFAHAEARAVAAGSWRALGQLRDALGLDAADAARAVEPRTDGTPSGDRLRSADAPNGVAGD